MQYQFFFKLSNVDLPTLLAFADCFSTTNYIQQWLPLSYQISISSKSKSKKKPRAVLLLLILPLKYIRNYCHAQKRRFQRKPSGKLLFHMYGHVVYLVTCNTQWDIIGKNSTICRHTCMCMEIFSLRGGCEFQHIPDQGC